MAIDVEKLIRDVRTANGAQTSARADSGHVAVVQGKGSSNGAQVSAKDDDDPWYLKAAKWIDAHKTDDADVTFNYGALTNGNRTLTETAERARAKSDTLRQANSAAAEALRQSQKPESSGTTFGKDHVDANKEGMSWWERLTANAANAADEAFGTYSPGNATSRSKVGNTVAGGLQETGGSMFEALGFVTDQKGDKTPTEADMAFGSGTLTDTLPFMKKFWQSISDKSYKQSDKLFKEAEESTIVAKDGSGTVGSFVVDAGKATTQLGADIVTAAVSGGSALVPMAIRSFGGGLREARDEGWSKQEQFNYAVGSAAIETMTEKLSSVALPFKAAYGKGAVDDIIERLISGSAKTEVGRASLRALFSAIGEGNEEMISDVLNPILKTLVRYDTSELDSFATPEFWSQTLRDGLLGASIGVFGSGGQVVGAAVNSRKGAQTAAGQDGTSFTVPVENGAQSATAPTDVPTMQQASDIVADVALGKVGADTQLNIDNTARPVYTGNSNINGGAQNVSGRSLEADSDGISGVYDSGDTGHQGRSRLGGNSVGSGFVLSAQAQNAIRSRGVDIVETKDVSANSAAFSAALDESRAANAQNGWAVTPKSAQEIAENGVRVYMNDSESTGYGIAPDGDIEAVFANKSKGAPRHALASVMPQAIANGGTKLDCYGLGLVRLYSRYGFVPVARVQFNAEYANEGWAPDKGAPDIYFMMATDLDPDSVAQNFGNYPVLTQAQLDALPVMDYDEAYAYRDSLLAQQGSNLPKGTGAAELGFTGEMTAADQWVAKAQGQGDDALHPISEESQRNLAEQQGRAAQEMPRVDLMGNLTSKTASTVMNSGVTSAGMSDAILMDAADGRFSRIAYPDNEAINKAEDEIENGAGRYQGALGRWKTAVADGRVSKDNMVMGICLYNNAVANGDYATALDVLDGIVNLGKNGAQAVQAVRILNKLSPEGRLYVAAKAVDNINAEIKAKYGDRAPDISVDEDLFAEYADALKNGDDAAIRDAWEAVEQNIADQIPSNWLDRLNNWRYLSMLGNPRTHIRNTVGNAGFMPVRMMKNVIGAGIESVADRASGNGIGRTKAVLNPFSDADRALIQLAWGDYVNSVDSIMSGGKYNDNYSGVENKRTIFRFRPLEAVRKFNTNALNAEDSWFSRPAYAESLASWLKANGYDAVSFSDGAMSAAELDKARDYAIREAQRATYRDTNAFAQWVTSLRVRTSNQTLNRISNAVIEGVLPFKKTPANILVRAVDYSPAGLIKTLTADSVRLRRGSITAAEYIDNLAQGLTGTALVGLGALLASLGIVSGGGDDDEQAAFDKLQGKQSYSITIGDWNASLDWLAPESMPLFVGVELYNKFADDSDEPVSLSEVLDTVSNITAPMLDMSMLQGVNEVLEGLDYSNGSALATITTKALGSLISQFFPTIFGQVERVFTPGRQTTFVDRNSDLSANMQRFLGNLGNKTPGVDFQQIDYIDAWGRTEDTGDVLPRFLNNMLNPANMKKSGVTDVDDELQRLYDSGETGVFPQRPAQNTKIDDEYLSAEEYVEYAKKRGSESLAVVRKLINSTAYKRMSDADKAAAIKEAYNYANGIAKQTVRRGTEVSSWIEKAKASGNPAQYITDRSIMKTEDTDGNGNFSNAEKVRGLIAGGYSGAQLTEKVREYMTSDSGNCALGDYLERAQAAKVPDSIALDVYEFNSGAHADKDENGKSISGSKKAKVAEYINSQQLTAAQKRALYYSLYKK